MFAKAGDPGFVAGRTSLVPHTGDRLPATITAKKRDAGGARNMANWVIYNAARHGVLANADFYKYLEHAEGAKLKAAVLKRQVTIEEVPVRSGWWQQGRVDSRTGTVLPDHLRFRLPEKRPT